MRIDRVEAIPLTVRLPKAQTTSQFSYTEISICLVRVGTDAGVEGVGECLARFCPQAYAALINGPFRDALIGQDPFEIGRHWNAMRKVLNGRSAGMLLESIAGVDIALWDIMGKAHGASLKRLLGGQCRASVPAYASSIMVSDDTEREAGRLLGLGFRILKMKIGNGIRTDLARVRRLRELVGPDIAIVTDVNFIYTEEESERLARGLAEFDVVWLEEPVHSDDRAGYMRLARKSPVALAGGESEFTAAGFADLLAVGAVKFVQPDVSRAGGVSECRKIALLADSFFLKYAPHVGFSGIVCVAASLQLAAAMPNTYAFESMINPNPFREELALNPYGLAEQLAGGEAEIPERPGLGIELDWKAVEKMRVKT
jgi:D-galactarolactone cycloisomerase